MSVTETCIACRFLRTKRMFINFDGEMDDPLKTDSVLNDQSFYWCNLTLTELGQDGQTAHPRSCVASRECFKPL